MENKGMKKNAPAELNEDALDNVHGGTSEIPTVYYPGVLMTKHQLSTDTQGEDDIIPVGAITEGRSARREDTMEKKLRHLFDYQKFQRNPRLDTMLSEAEERDQGSLSDDDLELVSAAGEPIPNVAIGLVIPELNGK